MNTIRAGDVRAGMLVEWGGTRRVLEAYTDPDPRTGEVLPLFKFTSVPRTSHPRTRFRWWSFKQDDKLEFLGAFAEPGEERLNGLNVYEVTWKGERSPVQFTSTHVTTNSRSAAAAARGAEPDDMKYLGTEFDTHDYRDVLTDVTVSAKYMGKERDRDQQDA